MLKAPNKNFGISIFIISYPPKEILVDSDQIKKIIINILETF